MHTCNRTCVLHAYCMHAYTYVDIHSDAYMQSYMHIACILHACIHICGHTYANTHAIKQTNMNTCIHNNFHTYVHVCIHAYMHMYHTANSHWFEFMEPSFQQTQRKQDSIAQRCPFIESQQNASMSSTLALAFVPK